MCPTLFRLFFALTFISGQISVTAYAARGIGLCQGGNRAARQVTCIVDGDTGWERGIKWRLAGVDAPEMGRNAECRAERRAAQAATARLLQLMQDGYTLVPTGKRGRYKRELVRVRLRDGRDAGEVLIAEGLAQRWPNRSNPWCR